MHSQITTLVALGCLLSSCSSQMVHGSALPSWPPSYDMKRSTFMMACNNTGPFNATFAAKWGIADFDWSNWKSGENGWTNAVPMDCEEKLARQAAMTKAVNPETRVFVCELFGCLRFEFLTSRLFTDRNMVKALPWYSSVRKKLVDPQYSDFFLHFNCNRSSGAKYDNGCHVPVEGTSLYHDQEQTPHGKTCGHTTGLSPCCGVPCGEYVSADGALLWND
jgi:hypothetical protein